MDLARRQNDVSSERKFNQAIRGYQAKLRELVKDNDFLTRQYDREQIGNPRVRSHEVLEKELSKLHKEYGPHGFPEDVQEYKRLLYNKDTGQTMHTYIQARMQHTVEPVVSYKDYIQIKKLLDREIIGITTEIGQVIRSYSDHTFDRIFGVRNDPKGKRRIGVSIDEMKVMLKSGEVKRNEQGHTFSYKTNAGYVVVNENGKIVTVIPRKGR